MPVYWVKADVPCGNLYWQIVIVDSTAAAVPVKFLQNERDMRFFICLFCCCCCCLLIFFSYYFFYYFRNYTMSTMFKVKYEIHVYSFQKDSSYSVLEGHSTILTMSRHSSP